jgi:polar amino acid transport system substrate-binding protein
VKFSLATSVVAAILASMTLLGCKDQGGDGSQKTVRRDLGLIQEGTLIVGSDIPYPPFEEGEPPEYEGFDIDVINAVAENLDLETQIENVPLNLILAGEHGKLDLSISAVKITAPREKRVNFSGPYFVASLSLLVRNDSEIQSVSDLKPGAVVGVEDGTGGETYARTKTDASEVRAFSSTDEAAVALFNSEVDVVIAAGSAGEEALEASEGLKIAATFPTREQYGIVVPRGNNALLDAVNEALRDLKEDGTLAELYEEHFEVEPPPRIAAPADEPQ